MNGTINSGSGVEAARGEVLHVQLAGKGCPEEMPSE